MNKATILIVDDNRDSLDLMQEILEPQGYEVKCATSGPEAVQMLREMTPVVVVLDIMMPDMNGFALLDIIRETPGLEGVPVILQTAHPTREHGRRTVDSGLMYMLAKPLDADLFVSAVEECIRSAGLEVES